MLNLSLDLIKTLLGIVKKIIINSIKKKLGSKPESKTLAKGISCLCKYVTVICESISLLISLCAYL